jgi:tetratricopeptide (TPR) repeat protein
VAAHTTPRVPEPALTDDITAGELDAEVRRDLRGLQRDTADTVARHLVAAGRLVDEDPELALEHARFARARASRIAIVREAAGIVAYHAGEWAEALGELRAARRMGGGPGHLAVMADIERALGRPERALELGRGPEARELGRAESIELAIVAAGARRDLGELDAAVVSLQIPELDPARRDPWSARLFYAYADNLLAAGRESDALQWFVHAADVDDDGETDAARRIAELTGEPLPEDDFDLGVEDDSPADAGGVDGGPATDDVEAEPAGPAVDTAEDGDRPSPDTATSEPADTDPELEDPTGQASASDARTDAATPDADGVEAAGSDPDPEPSGGTGPVGGAGSEDASDTGASDTEVADPSGEGGADEERDRGASG